MKLIIIFGPPYSGKGTQGKLVAQKLNYVHISTGDELRNEKQQNTELGNMAQEYSKKGLLVPDNLLEIIVDRAFYSNADRPGIILDGYPRTISQADTLSLLVKKHGIELKTIVFLEVGMDELISRAIERGRTSEREDDRNPDIIRKRIEVYHTETKPVGDYYSKIGLVSRVSGEGNISEITERIIGVVQEKRL